MKQPRRAALTTIASTVALTVVPFSRSSAQTARDATLQVAVLPDFAVAPIFAARDQGYFADENLTLTIQDMAGGGAAMIPALVAGDIDIAFANAPSVALAVGRGIDLRILLGNSPITNKPPSSGGLVKRAGTSFATGKDLEGQTLAVNALASLMWVVARSWIKVTGGDPAKVNFVELPVPSMTGALDTNRVAGAMIIDPNLTLALEQSQKYTILAWPFNVVWAFVPTSLWVCTAQALKTKAPLVQAFVRALRRGVAWVNDNRGKDSLVTLLSSYSHVQPDVIRKVPMPLASATLDTTHLGTMLKLMRENNLLTKDLNLAAQIYNVP